VNFEMVPIINDKLILFELDILAPSNKILIEIYTLKNICAGKIEITNDRLTK
jgi:hypothetical protein